MHPLAKARIQAGISQLAASLAIGISPSTYQRWENGKVPIPAEKYPALCALFGTTAGELEGQAAPFDYLGIDPSVPDERRYFGEIAIHFAAGPALLLPISCAARSTLLDDVPCERPFFRIDSLDNRIIVVRSCAVGDLYISSDACDTFGPEHGTYKPYAGIYPDDEFWEGVEEFAYGGLDQELADSICVSDETLDSLANRGRISADDRQRMRAEADAAYIELEHLATFAHWQLSSGRSRDEYVSDDGELVSMVDRLLEADEETGLHTLTVVEWNQYAIINPQFMDYFSVPAHRYRRSALAALSRTESESPSRGR